MQIIREIKKAIQHGNRPTTLNTISNIDYIGLTKHAACRWIYSKRRIYNPDVLEYFRPILNQTMAVSRHTS